MSYGTIALNGETDNSGIPNIDKIKIANLLREKQSRKYYLISSVIFTIGSYTSLVNSFATTIPDPSVVNIGQLIGYIIYSIAYTIYLYAEFRYNKYTYIFSTVTFTIGSLVFVIFAVYDTWLRKDFGLANMASNVGNFSWLIGYLFSYRGELLAPAKNNLDLLSGPILHGNHNSNGNSKA
jgi:hypothetical protein